MACAYSNEFVELINKAVVVDVLNKFGVWKSEMETRGLKVNINKTMLMVMGREPAVRPQRGRYPCGVCGKRSWSKLNLVSIL